MILPLAYGQTTPPWTYTNTGSNHTVGIADTALSSNNGCNFPFNVSIGDYYGVFYDSLGHNACAGFAPFTGGFVGLAAMGDDATTAAPDGLGNGEPMQFFLWDSSTGVVEELFMGDYDISLDPPNYVTNGMTVITEFCVVTSGFKEDAIGLKPKLYPNPSNGEEVFINWEGISSNEMQLILYSMSGRRILEESLSNKVERINFSQLNLKKGFYMLEMSNDSESYMIKVQIL